MILPQEIIDEIAAVNIAAMRRYSDATRGTAGESAVLEQALAAYDGKPKTPVQYWHDRAVRAEAELERLRKRWWNRG